MFNIYKCNVCAERRQDVLDFKQIQGNKLTVICLNCYRKSIGLPIIKQLGSNFQVEISDDFITEEKTPTLKQEKKEDTNPGGWWRQT